MHNPCVNSDTNKAPLVRVTHQRYVIGVYMYEYLAIPKHQFRGVAPEVGSFVLCLMGEKKKLWAGVVVMVDDKWAVKTPSGKILYPYLSDVLKQGCSLKHIKSTIMVEKAK